MVVVEGENEFVKQSHVDDTVVYVLVPYFPLLVHFVFVILLALTYISAFPRGGGNTRSFLHLVDIIQNPLELLY